MPKYKVHQRHPAPDYIEGDGDITTEINGYDCHAEHGFFRIYSTEGTSIFGCPLHLLINVTEAQD